MKKIFCIALLDVKLFLKGLVLFFVFGVQAAYPLSASDSRASLLVEKHAALTEQLTKNQYRRPLFLESIETSDKVSSTVYAVLDSPFATVSETLKKPDLWCEILILHLNTKYCHAYSNSNLEVRIGKKTPQSLSEAFLLDFSHKVSESSANYVAVQLFADTGPLSTTDYRIELQAIPMAGSKTFMYLRYSYGFGVAGRLAMRTYLATLGRGKIGFTQIAKDQELNYVGGMRGAVERNTMRYYLAIEAYLASLKKTASAQQNARFQYWFDATEEYSEQLHEVDKNSYIEMKKDEYQRQKSAVFKTQ